MTRMPRISTIHTPRLSTLVARVDIMNACLRGLLFFIVGIAVARAQPSIVGVDGRPLTPFAPRDAARVLFFVQTDCPIANTYAPEIQQICGDFASRGVDCMLIYEDVDTHSSPETLNTLVRAHLRDYRYGNIPAAIDRQRTIATHAVAKTTPQAVVVDRAGTIRYRGRIDNFYAALGTPRQQVTQRDLRRALDDVIAGRPVATAETPALGCHIADPVALKK